MCGIFGLILKQGSTISSGQAQATLAKLFRLSETRGKESAGVHLWLPTEGKAWTLKAPIAATAFIRSATYEDALGRAFAAAYAAGKSHPSAPIVLLGHSRLVTNGAAELDENNQPVRRNGVTVVHNGIVVNVDDLWARHPGLVRTAQVDTEILAALLSERMSTTADAPAATRHVYRLLRGSASIAWTHDRGQSVVLASNTGDLYACVDESAGCAVFASEQFILKHALEGLNECAAKIAWLPAGQGMAVDVGTLCPHRFALSDDHAAVEAPLTAAQCLHHDIAVGAPSAPAITCRQADASLLKYDESLLRSLRRCTSCVLPETFPFIEFDRSGRCNYCQNYVPRYKGRDTEASKRAFIESMQKHRSSDGRPDAVVAFSGGRDSSYGLHLIKHEMGFTPITFTYDWGMVTDLARRNVARMCGQLGIQNVLVSADIRAKRENIRKNVAAWLRKPDLGLIPLFMAGDKHFFRVVNQLKRQTGIGLDLWCANPLENTDFKAGFCGVPPDFGKKAIDHLSLSRKAAMALHYAKAFATNPALINSSLLDTANAFWSYYFEPRAGMHLIFDHMAWNEDEVNDVLCNQYDWETAEDTKSTWRIGDGTAPFYNYIYVTARGFSEFDTFRSNQVREGMLSREAALQSVLVENRPRFHSLRWYLEAINLPFDETIKTINRLDPFHGRP